MSNVFYTLRKTIQNYASGGTVLMVATVLALLIVNFPGCRDFYNSLWEHEITLQIGSFNLFSHHGEPMSIMTFINDALMVIFFFSVGLEIKREVLVGELHSVRKAMLPVIAACGGMIIPVVIFYIVGLGSDFERGAAIPMATDIAFSLGVLSMLGKRVPISLKIFLTTLAVVDDIGGILVIAIFYSSHIDYWMLLAAAGLLLILAFGGRMKIQSKLFYLGVGTVVWFFFLNAGIHPTIAGVLIAFCIPAKPVSAPLNYIKTIREKISSFAEEKDETLQRHSILSRKQMNNLKEIESASDKVISPLQDMEDSLHPVVNYLIVPIFAFANAGIYLGDLKISMVFSGVSLAVMLGLVLGKFIGIFLFSWITIKLKWAPMPTGCNWRQMASIAMLGGIGFTVSMFIANLSFGTGDPYHSLLLNEAKLGILVGSLLAGFLGWLFLHMTLPKTEQDQGDD